MHSSKGLRDTLVQWKPLYNKVLGTMKITLLYQVSLLYSGNCPKKYKELGPAKWPCHYKRVLLLSDLFIRGSTVYAVEVMMSLPTSTSHTLFQNRIAPVTLAHTLVHCDAIPISNSKLFCLLKDNLPHNTYQIYVKPHLKNTSNDSRISNFQWESTRISPSVFWIFGRQNIFMEAAIELPTLC